MTATQIATYYHELAAKLVNYLVAHGLDYSTACDIVQETFVRLWNKRDALSGDDSISGFVFTVARNLRTDFLRKNRGVVFQEEITDGDAAGIAAPERAQSDLKYLRLRLRQALAQLPEDLREAYVLAQVGKNSIREVASIMEASESLIKVRIHRAKEKLRKLLSDLQDF